MHKKNNASKAGGASRRSFLKVTAGTVSTAALAGLDLSRSAYAAASDTIKVGVVGCGNRGTGAALNAMNADPGVRLVAMADLFKDRVLAKRQQLQEQRPNQVAVDDDHCFDGFAGYRHVIDSVDVVLIACAAKFHPLYLRSGLEAGKHVFVEKPHAIDPLGVREVTAACELAKQKKLCVVSGLQSRYHAGYQETIKRIHDGAIGEVVSIEENFLRAPYGVYERKPGLNEVQYQCSNQYHFSWLSGDDVPQSLVHNIDRATWVMHEQPPLKAHGLGGRSASFDEKYGDVFDHHSVIYEYANGVRMYTFCRTQVNCYNENSSILLGSKGRCNLTKMTIEGERSWRYEGPPPKPYDAEHERLYAAIRAGKTINNGDYMARSTLIAVLGQLSCYSGSEVTWEQASRSEFSFAPRPEHCSFDMEPPVALGADGRYPVPIPGVTKMM